ncbi:MAG: hypothetical protein JOZ90_00715 [Alphaproteobacteria bacterium]|nr:hypothetical protein [Alphaproteobacteria bacterium]MBV9372306.1 hypothetical protein [Alphaproteobacteria bacterium]MBV9899598.1 hypothetical protein [Alphaproteobacteria bacterium]
MSTDRQTALADFRRTIKWIAVAGVLMVIGALLYLRLFIPLNATIVVATTGGVFFSVLLGCGLFAAAFFSDKSGLDQQVADAAKRDGFTRDRGHSPEKSS